MSRLRRRNDPPTQEIELLDAELFEVPRRFSDFDARDHAGVFSDRRPFNHDELRDDR